MKKIQADLSKSRYRSITILLDWAKEGRSIKNLIENNLHGLESRDQAFVRKLVYGIMENLRYLDYLLDKIMDKPVAGQKAPVAFILRQALYESIFLETPFHAAVNENVSLSKRFCPYARGFINAILRKFERNKEKLTGLKASNSLQDLCIFYSIPDWMGSYLDKELGRDKLKAILELSNKNSPISIFVKGGEEERDSISQMLKDQAIETRKSLISKYALLADGGPISDSQLFKKGKISIQSQASIKVCELMTASLKEKKGRILDLCAAPGSKSIAMKSMANDMEITANDIEGEKLKYIEDNARRMGLSINTSCRDGRIFYKDWFQKFDAVLLDAPCSGLGLIGRKADIRWNRKEEDIDSLCQIQRDLLKKAALYVKPGGRLIYSTCTYGRKENEDIIADLDPELWEKELINHKEGSDICKSDVNILKYSPLDEGADGFFMAAFKRHF